MKDDAHRAYREHLLGRMADVLGLDLDLEVDLSRLSRDRLERAIALCDDCPDQDGCATWLGDHTTGASAAPRICRNRDLLARLHRHN